MMIVGTSDFSYSYDKSRVEKMRNSRYFKEQTSETVGNFIICTKEGYSHDGTAASEYTFNALSYLWKEKQEETFYKENTKMEDVLNDPVFQGFRSRSSPSTKTIKAEAPLKSFI